MSHMSLFWVVIMNPEKAQKTHNQFEMSHHSSHAICHNDGGEIKKNLLNDTSTQMLYTHFIEQSTQCRIHFA